MASSVSLLLLLVLLCAVNMYSEAQITNMVDVSTSAANQINSSVLRFPLVANYSDLNYFRSRISILSDGRYLAGAINKLYLVRSDLSGSDDMLTWVPTDTLLCRLALGENMPVECSNHIRIHHVQEDNRIVVCGTNAIQPRCRIVMLNDFTNMGSLFTPQAGLVPFHPDAEGLTITDVATPGGILAVNYLDANNDDFGISYQILNTSTGTIQNSVTYRTITGSINWLRGPATYVDYYADNYTTDGSLDFYFIFLREQSVEISGTDSQVIYSRVVRLCKNDPGSGSLAGSSMFRAEYFYTYVKALIFCKVPKPVSGSVPGSTDYQFNSIQKVSLRRNSVYMVGEAARERVVYGLFTGPTYGPPGSAICVYSADNTGVNDNGIFTVFNEEYHNLRPGQTSCTANNIPNDNPFTCDTSTHDSRRGQPETEVLMSPSVAQLTTHPLVILEGITATHIYTTQAYVRNDTNGLSLMDVMFVGTNEGKILKIVMTYNGTHHVPLVSEELSLADNLPIQNMEPQFVNDQLDHLLINTDAYIYRVPPQRCNRFSTCMECVSGRDPHCFWEQNATVGCKPLPNVTMYDSEMWYQNIHTGMSSQFTNCSGVPLEFTVAHNVVDESSVDVIIDVITQDDLNTIVVTLTIEQLSSCPSETATMSSMGPMHVVGTMTQQYTGLLPYTMYRVTVTRSGGGSFEQTVTFRTRGTNPVTPSISAVYPTANGLVVYPSIGCLRDEISNYTITVAYQYTACGSSTTSTDSQSLPAVNGSVFTFTDGAGPYADITSVTVTVQNNFGTNMSTNTQGYRTNEGLPTMSNTISGFGVTSTSSSLLLSWSDPINVCGVITGYSVRLSSNQITNCNVMSPYNITGLQPFSSYTVSVAACTIAGEGPMFMVTGSVMTSAGTPAPVGAITATGNTASSVTFSWSAVAFNGNSSGYMVDYTCYGRGAPQTDTATTTNPTYTITDINCYEASCFLRAAAINTAGNTGLYSIYGTGTTSCPAALPSSAAATGITSETISMNTATIRWTVPSNYCGPSRTFTVRVAQGSNPAVCSVTSTSQTYYSCQNLVSSQSYTISVTTMITCGGNSIQSAPSTSSYSHPCFISDPPSNVVITRGNTVQVGWDAVSCGSNVMYNVHWSCGNGDMQMATVTTSIHTLDLSGQTSFSFCLAQVQACNDRGCGRFSDIEVIQVPLQAPPPVSLTGAVNGTTAIIMFTISQPTDLNDLRYTLRRRQTRPMTTSFQNIATNVAYNFTNLLRDEGPNAQETYEYEMILSNTIGNSQPSNVISITTTQEPPPAAPTQVTVNQVGDTLMVNWVAPQGGRPLTYTVIYGTLPASNESQMMSGVNGLTHTFSNFQVFDTPCVVAVQSTDTMTGLTGSFSYSSECFIRAVMRPGPPVVTNISYGDKLFELNWTPPSDPNGFILEYIIMLVNNTASSANICADNCDTVVGGYTTIRVGDKPTSYMQVFEVSESTCFCAAVNASNTVGSAQSDQVVFWYEYVPPPVMTVPISVTVVKTVNVTISIPQVTRLPTTVQTDDDAPIVAIILAVVLVAVVIATVVLGLVFCKMYLLTRETNGNEKPKGSYS
ncbi:uncharacterized protein [Dysidea avara]|uniref:uncharacterized protein isoform X2 n=1 Tax=Dysidea avara TaxID=196820 RepID=UPI00332EF352